MEFRPLSMKAAGVSRNDLERTLIQLGFRHGYVIETGESVVAPAVLPTRAVYNVFLTKDHG